VEKTEAARAFKTLSNWSAIKVGSKKNTKLRSWGEKKLSLRGRKGSFYKSAENKGGELGGGEVKSQVNLEPRKERRGRRQCQKSRSVL